MAKNKPDYGVIAVCFIIFYFAFEALFVSVISQGAGLDDAELASNISFWNWGYGGSQPPLYTWIAFAVEQLFGLHFYLLQIIKFGLLATTFLSVYLALRLLDVRPVVAGASMLAMFLLPQIGWESQRALTHSIIGTAGAAYTFLAFCFFCRKPSFGRAILLGLACATAILGKYNGALFLIALFGGTALTRDFRSALKNRYFPLAIVVALIAIAPATIYMSAHPASVVARANKLAMGKTGGFFTDRLTGLADFFTASLGFVSIALIIALILAGLHSFSNSKVSRLTTRDENKAEHLIYHILLFGILLVVALVLVLGITNVKDRWLQPLLFLAPAYFAIVLSRLCYSLKYVRAFGVIGAIAGLVVPFVLYLNIATAYNRFAPPEQLFDYKTLDRTLRAEGPFVMVFARHPQLPGNLRLLDPTLKTIHIGSPFVIERLKTPLMVLWTGNGKLPDDLRATLLKAGLPTTGKTGEVEIGFSGGSDVKRIVSYLYLP
ncbi:ArnT family glycosyltransferase [Bartonella choladocola]|uniref:Dolichyl-phosphate-mannose-protein mannosyltransferase n=1 Tax=Bartonella choladocola TaxID=2750995 RepID=A0A1U9MIV3_9HYPH|nr:glycosyltransferase family 39 protein [Bartonella choladocola]AQT47668.1 Dolichyl-phosphate-mannose-protein mannosyltransferase [Bartonella choladocola]